VIVFKEANAGVIPPSRITRKTTIRGVKDMPGTAIDREAFLNEAIKGPVPSAIKDQAVLTAASDPGATKANLATTRPSTIRGFS